jgi:hypothetical protein
VFKATYLDFPEADRLAKAAEQQIIEARKSSTRVFAEMMPAIMSVEQSGIRLERRVAVLRVVEAIRMYAAAHGGALPESLANVTIVPVPDDPATGKPFSYTCRDGVAEVTGGPVDERPKSEVGYRLSIRP